MYIQANVIDIHQIKNISRTLLRMVLTDLFNYWIIFCFRLMIMKGMSSLKLVSREDVVPTLNSPTLLGKKVGKSDQFFQGGG